MQKLPTTIFIGKNFLLCIEKLTPLCLWISTSMTLFYFFKGAEQFMILERNELYGVSDLISNFGGLLGLFTGFSLITL
ncbi:ASC domain containing protein, partial [Asbolus verrucosus]